MKELLNLIQLNDIKTIKKLLNNKLYTQKEKNKALKEAAFLGNINIMKLLIKAGANVNAPNNNILKAAVQGNHLESVKLLISQGAIVNKKNVLLEAAKAGNTDIIKILIKAGIDLNTKNKDILLIAIKNNQIDTVKYLISQGAIANKNNILLSSIETGDANMFNTLKEYGLIDIFNIPQAEAVRESIEYDNVEIFKYLNESGNISDHLLERAFDVALDKHKYNIVHYCLDNNIASIDLFDTMYDDDFDLLNIPQIKAVKKSIECDNAKMFKSLIQNQNISDRLLEVAFTVALHNHKNNIIYYYLDNSLASVDLLDALHDDNLDLVKYLIKKGANPFLKEEEIICYSARSAEMFNYFKDLGLNIHVNNQRAIEIAIGYNNMDTAKQIIDELTEPIEENLLNEYLIVSLRLQNLEMADYFIKKGANPFLQEDEIICHSAKSSKMLNYFKALGLNIHINNKRAIESAIDYSNADTVKQIIEELSEPIEDDLLNKYLLTSLRRGNLEMADYFIKKGADIHKIILSIIDIVIISNYATIKYLINKNIKINLNNALTLSPDEKIKLSEYKHQKKKQTTTVDDLINKTIREKNTKNIIKEKENER